MDIIADWWEGAAAVGVGWVMTLTHSICTVQLPFCLEGWGSNPDEGNDDCYYGAYYATIDEARAALDAGYTDSSVQFFVLDGPALYEMRENPYYKPRAERDLDDGGDWRREAQMQAAMEFGCDGWNEFEGM